MIDSGSLTGSIPTEIGELTGLTSLGLGKQLFSVLLVYFETKQILSLLLTFSLSYFLSYHFDRL